MHLSITIIGYGRFGRAVAGLFVQAGHRVRAFDPAADIPDELRAASIGEALSSPGIVLLCVPVPAVGEALRSMAGSIGAEHLVIDVASVRAPVEQLMGQELGDHVPWAGSHPLFGPSSIALGEKPLRVVVCPNPHHPSAAARARAMYESIGCEVIEEDSAAHDRSMAYSHALAFYLAKGMIDIDAISRTRFVPPSFRSMLNTIDSVRSDAGHLFFTIERLNPFAAQARADLLASLSRLHDELEAVDPSSLEAGGEFDIPDLGEAAPELLEAREVIDELDRELIGLIARRTEVAARAGRIKGERSLPVRDPSRERALLADRRAWAEGEQLDPDSVARLFEELMALSRRVQQDRPDSEED